MTITSIASKDANGADLSIAAVVIGGVSYLAHVVIDPGSGLTPVTGTFGADGVSTWFTPEPKRPINLSCNVGATFGGGVVSVERSYDGGTTAAPQRTGAPAFMAPFDETVDTVHETGIKIRAKLTGATSPSIIYRLGH